MLLSPKAEMLAGKKKKKKKKTQNVAFIRIQTLTKYISLKIFLKIFYGKRN